MQDLAEKVMRVAEEQRAEIQQEDREGEADEERDLLGAALRNASKGPPGRGKRGGFGGDSDDGDDYGDEYLDEEEIWREVDGDLEEVSAEDQVSGRARGVAGRGGGQRRGQRRGGDDRSYVSFVRERVDLPSTPKP